jgi:hypothetical protein
MRKASIEKRTFLFQDARSRINPCALELLDSSARNNRMRVNHTNDNAANSTLNDCFSARWLFPMVGAWFKIDVKCCTFRTVSQVPQSIDFRMHITIPMMVSLSDDLSIANNDTSNLWVRAYIAAATLRKFQGTTHEELMLFLTGHCSGKLMVKEVV